MPLLETMDKEVSAPNAVRGIGIRDFRCPDCTGPVVEFLWPIFICMRCHSRRSEEQARTGRDLLEKLVGTDLQNHQNKKFLPKNPLRICQPCQRYFDHEKCQELGCECENVWHRPTDTDRAYYRGSLLNCRIQGKHERHRS